jgi:tetratricopeptide (TPR) repeat protein
VPSSIWPFLGPRPFEREHEPLFFGREREASDLLSLVVAHREVLFYAQSGAGKTSLLNAKLLSLLEAEGLEVLPKARVWGLIPENSSVSEIRNLYIYNVLKAWAGSALGSEELAQLSLKDFLRKGSALAGNAGDIHARVIVFDQFEEIFALYEERSKDRKGFFEQVGEALDADPLLRVLFVMREESIAQLDPYSSLLPEKLRTRFRLESLRYPAALSCVKGPLRNTIWSFEEGVAEQLVEELLKIRVETATGQPEEIRGEFVEPVQLQVVCHSLGEQLPSEVTSIGNEHLGAFGDVDLALSRFYEKGIKAVTQLAPMQEGVVRSWIETWLITSTGTRAFVHREPQFTRSLPNKNLEILEDHHIVRSEPRAGARWYELTHDRFVKPILSSNQKWREGKIKVLAGLRYKIEQGLKEGDLDGALKLSRECHAMGKEIADAWEAAVALLYVGEVFGRQKKPEQASEAYLGALQYREAIADKKVIALLLLNLADAWFAMERFDDSIRAASDVIQLAPTDQRGYSRRAGACWYAEYYDQAFENYSKVLAMNPASPPALNGRGHVLAEMNKYQEAIRDLDQAISLSSNNPLLRAYAQNGRALAYAGHGDYQRALSEFEDSLKLSPNNAWAHYNRAVTYEWMGQRESAISDFVAALEKNDPKLSPLKRAKARARLELAKGRRA